MKLNLSKIKELCAQEGLTLSQMLQEAGVSRNAFYSLARKKSVVPASVEAVARRLKVPSNEIVERPLSDEEKYSGLAEQARRIVEENPGSSWENIYHTLVLLEEEPINRLRRALRRGRYVAIRRPGN